MKKALLSLATGLLLASGSFAQNITINELGQTTNLSGQIHDYELSASVSDFHMVDFLFNNLSNTGQPWIITRRILNEPVGWGNYYCWGVEGQLGSCYAADTNEYFNSGIVTVPVQSAGLVATYITSPDAGVATYRYYVSTDGATYLDSMDLRVTSVLSLTDLAPSLSVSISPNPASDYITVSADGVDDATVRIMDVLGNLISTKKITGSKTFDVSEYRNGIYFVIVESSGVKTVNRKVVIRH